MAERFDVVVVGAGPAGSMAAVAAARRGCSVCLLERGPYPGSKNLFGGVLYGGVLDDALPEWRSEAPIERWVTRRVTMVLSGRDSLGLDLRRSSWGSEPFNGATVLRPRLDTWLAEKAVHEGAVLATSTTATDLLRDERGVVTGVVTDRPDGELAASVVISCEGANPFLARRAGLVKEPAADAFTLGVKQVLSLSSSEIERRFALAPGEGAEYEVLGATGDVAGGAFLYTNSDSLSVGLVLSLAELRDSGMRPDDLLAAFMAHPAIEPLVAGGAVEEYGAHLVEEGGPHGTVFAGDGILVAGDAAGLCLAAGLYLEGVNFALASGRAAGEVAAEAVRSGDTSVAGLSGYRARLKGGFVLKDHERLRRAPDLVMSTRFQHDYPAVVLDVLGELFSVRNAVAKPGLGRVARGALKRRRLGWGHVVRDAVRAWRVFG